LSTSQFSLLVDSSHGTSGSTGTGTNFQSTGSPGSVGQLSGVSSSGEAEEAISGKRKPKWLQDTLKEVETVGNPRNSTRESRPPERFCNYVAMVTDITESEPSSYEEATTQQVWREAMVEEYASIMQNDVWEVVPRPDETLVISSKWLYKIKYVADGSIEKYKARFVAREFSQREGVDYNETFASHVCRLKKVLYGLKQAPRAWYSRIDAYLQHMDFMKRDANPYLYYIVVDGEMLMLILYVDDLFIIVAEKLIEGCKRDLASEFDMKDIRLMHYFLGLEVWQEEGHIFLGQGKYIVDILSRFHMGDCKPMSTPMATKEKELYSSDCGLVDPTLYRRLIGSLMYLVNA
jgi:hypothetical protein